MDLVESCNRKAREIIIQMPNYHRLLIRQRAIPHNGARFPRLLLDYINFHLENEFSIEIISKRHQISQQIMIDIRNKLLELQYEISKLNITIPYIYDYAGYI